MERGNFVASISLRNGRRDAVHQVGVARGIGTERCRRDGGGAQGWGAVSFQLKDLKGGSGGEGAIQGKCPAILQDLFSGRAENCQIALLIHRFDGCRRMNLLVRRLKIDAGCVSGHVGRHQDPSPGNDGS